MQRVTKGHAVGTQPSDSLANVPAPLAQEHTRRALSGTMESAGWLHCQPTLKRQVTGSQPVTFVPLIIHPLSHISALPSGFWFTRPSPQGGGLGGGGLGGGGLGGGGLRAPMGQPESCVAHWRTRDDART